MHCTTTVVAFAFVGLFGFATPNVTAETITVCASGCDYTSINAAIDASSNGDVIQLAAETYTEGSVIDTDGKAITLRGVADKTGAPASILDGGGSHRLLQCLDQETNATVFENLVIQNGFTELEGGGMFVDCSSPTLNNCTFMENSASDPYSGRGGGMYNSGSSPTLTDCTFTGNLADTGGGMYNSASSPTLANCSFVRNEGWGSGGGGGMANVSSSAPTMTDCTFTANISISASGMFNDDSDPTLIRCDFNDHFGEFGGALLNLGSSPRLQGCTFSGNEAFYGAGIWNEQDSSPTLTFCTFTDNANYDGQGSAIWNNNSDCTPTIQACGFSCNLPLGQDPIEGLGGYVDAGCNCIRLDCVACDIGDDDSDGLCNELDGCPDDPLKTESGSCGCGVVDTEVHGDLDCDGDYDEDDIRAGMVEFGIASGTPGDLDGDGNVDLDDRAALNDALGLCAADIDGDGQVDGADLAQVLGYWGVCSAP